MFNDIFFQKSSILRDYVEKYRRKEQATYDDVTCTLHAAYLRLQARTQNMQ